MSLLDYNKAYKLGEKEYKSCIAKGEYPYLPVLDDLLSHVEIEKQESLGLVHIPLKLVVGTYAAGRTTAFARNFMPILEQDSEFALQNIGNVINRRWTSGKPLIVTTNLDLANIRNVKEQELMFARISDRILDMCRPIHMQTVESKRVASGRHKNDILKEIFREEG